MMQVVSFLKYNNAVPIAVSIALLGAGGAFAATDPQAIYSSQQQVLSVDNSYIANKDLSAYSPRAQITSVTEDTDFYYVNYTLATIDVQNYVWEDISRPDQMKVAKSQLGQSIDLGVYVTDQLKQIIDREKDRLVQAQSDARKNLSAKTVSTTYGGLVGKFLDDTTETLPGYTPVVTPPAAEVAAAAASQPSGSSSSSGGSALLSLQLLGNNPAVIPLNTNYADLGVVLQDPGAPNLGYHAFVDGTEQVSPSIDTSTTSVHRIEYRATDQQGNIVMVRRIVLVGGATDPGGEISSAGSTGSTPPPQQSQPVAPPPPSNPPPQTQSAPVQQSASPSSNSSPQATTTTAATTTTSTAPSSNATTTALQPSSDASSTPASTNASSASSTATSTSP